MLSPNIQLQPRRYGPEDDHSNAAHMGVIPRAVSYIFSEIEHDPSVVEARIKCSFLEIYKEKLRDLLSPSNKDLRIRLQPSGETWVTNLTGLFCLLLCPFTLPINTPPPFLVLFASPFFCWGRVWKCVGATWYPHAYSNRINQTDTGVNNLFDVLHLIGVATGYRTRAHTSMNATSSRSHMLMTMTVALRVSTLPLSLCVFAALHTNNRWTTGRLEWVKCILQI